MKLLPSTLFGRLLSSLLLSIGVTLAVMVALIVRDRAELSLRVGGIGDTSRRIVDIVRLLEPLHGDAREKERLRLGADTTLRLEPAIHQDTPPSPDEIAAIERAFAAELRDRLGDGYRVSLILPKHRNPPTTIRLVPRGRSDLPILELSLWLPDGDVLRFRIASPPPSPPLPWALFRQLGVLTLVLVAVLFVVTRTITRPLTNLARAADAAGRSVHHPPLPEDGVQEIREATRAFNAMQDRLLRYLDSRTRVLGAMSHDLRTPLTRLRLRVESISDERLRERFSTDLDETESMVHGALALFSGLNDEEPFERVDVNALFGALVAGYVDVGANVSLEGRASSGIDARPRALKRCLTNLVDNALKFGNRASIRIDDDRELIIAISDDGPGVPEELLERVFEPFYQLDDSRNRDTGDTGLGLSIARDIAQAHGGTLALRNHVEGGLIAELRLPRSSHALRE